MRGRLSGAAAVVAGVLVVAGASGQDQDPTTSTEPETTTTTAPPWRESQEQVVIEARRTIWLDGQSAPPPPQGIEVDVVVVEEIDGAQVAMVTSCIVSEQGVTFDILGGIIDEGGVVTVQRAEVMGWVDGSWRWITFRVGESRQWEGEAGCATN